MYARQSVAFGEWGDLGCLHGGDDGLVAQYPYRVWLNWDFSKDDGFILYNDKKFVTLLYEKHQDYFEDMSRVSDASDVTKFGI